MLKCVEYQDDVKEIVKYYREFYDSCTPFQTQQDRTNYKLETREYITNKYTHLNDKMSLSIDYVAIIVELFCLNERQTDGAYMFKELLDMIYSYADGAANYVQLLNAAKPGFR